jgi:hypothetical protein
MTPGPQRETVIDDFWRFFYSGYYTAEVDSLRARARALAEYIGALDEERRGVADSGSSVLALE